MHDNSTVVCTLSGKPLNSNCKVQPSEAIKGITPKFKHFSYAYAFFIISGIYSLGC